MKLIIFCTSISILFITNSFAWENTRTHPDLSEFAARSYFSTVVRNYFSATSDFLDNDVKGQKAIQWIRDGAEHEDDGFQLKYWTPAILPPRYLNHFHAPTRSLDTAGLDDTILNVVLGGISTVIWAQDAQDQNNATGGDWSWQAVRNYYYNYLTANTIDSGQDSLANLLTGLGHQMHLLQDMSQPDHVRNNTHMLDGSGLFYGLETWAKNNYDVINGFAQGVIPDVTVDLTQPFVGSTSKSVTLMPVARLLDTRTYYNSGAPSAQTDQGLSEYTNANFFSHSSILGANRFSPGDDYYFPYPRKESTDLQSYLNKTKLSALDTVAGKNVDQANYISKTGDGETLTYLARQGVSTRFIQSVLGEGNSLYGSFKLDDACYYNYAQKLIPMAVGYSKALLDYFYRGTIELTIPSKGIYGIAAPDGSFNQIRVKARNSTASGEEMSNGTFQLVVMYNLALSDPFQNAPVDVAPTSYIVVPEKNGVTTISKTTTTELVFDLSSNPIPLWATNVYLQVVYKGQLGNEANSVAVGFNDISEPTPIDVINNMDYVCINGTYMLAGSSDAITAADANHDGKADADVFRHGLINVYASFNGVDAYSGNYSARFSSIPPGNYGRVFVLADYTEYSLNVSVNVTVQKLDPKDTFSWYFNNYDASISGLPNNQEYYPSLFTSRGLSRWFDVYDDNHIYPVNGPACSWTTESALIGPVAAVVIP